MTETNALFQYFVVMGNSDQTEGRGRMVPKKSFLKLEDAVKWADSPNGHRACGVMGHGPGDVEMHTFFDRGDGTVDKDAIRIWGHRRDLTGKWGHGYVDNRDAPVNDPDFQEYLRLKQKFEAK